MKIILINSLDIIRIVVICFALFLSMSIMLLGTFFNSRKKILKGEIELNKLRNKLNIH